jgi:dTDP-4-amino-4,6-dideoxygalactose transaminase
VSELAINGGPPVRTRPFREYNPFGPADKDAVARVIDRGLLSGFVGSRCDDFYGGPEVRALERAWCDAFGVSNAVAMNSATSALIAAVAALEIEPGEEVIVTPFTMSATVAAVLFNEAIPIFVDVETESFNLDPAAIEAAITPRTRAILVVHLFGQPADMTRIMEVANRYDLPVIEDNAQSMGATVAGRYAGTFGAIGIFSLNRHKLIQTGEGGICVTDDPDLALRLQLIRNHGENAAQGFGILRPGRLLGYNFRMTELEAAVANVQFAARADVLNRICEMARYLDDNIAGLPGLRAAPVRADATHVYMHHTLLYDESETGVSRNDFVAAVKAEGVPVWGGYIEPLYMLPVFREAQSGNDDAGPGWLRTLRRNRRQIYVRGLCPNAESLHAAMINHDLHRPPNTLEDMADIVAAFRKVSRHIDELRR